MNPPDLLVSCLILVRITVQMTQVHTERQSDRTLTANVTAELTWNQNSDTEEHRRCDILPCVCYKDKSLFVVNCSHNHLTSVPLDIPRGVQVLDLSYNKLKRIPSGTFSNFSDLETLHLSNNLLTHFQSGLFLGLSHLKTLNINGNLINLTNETFADDVFLPLPNLTYLNLKQMWQTENQSFQYPDVALGKIPALETLLISGLSNRTFGEGVRNLTSLQRLDMSSTPSFSSISRETFINFRNIAIYTLDLSHCNLTWIHREAFLHLPNIDTIDYSYNPHLNFRAFGESAYGLKNSTIKKLLLQHIHAPPTLISLTSEYFKYLTNTKLEEVYLDKNSIGNLDERVLKTVPVSLKVISASYNNLQTHRAQIMGLFRFRNLEKIDVSYQETYGESFVESVAVSRSKVLEASTDSTSKGPVDRDNLSKIGYGTGTGTTTTFIRLNMPPHLWMINCSHTYKLKFTIPALELVNSSVTHVNLAHNLLGRWKGPIKGAEKLLFADLTGNNCYDVSETFFSYMTGLETLRIGKNRLGRENHLSEKTFSNLTSLKRLVMNDNQIQTLPKDFFSGLKNLIELNLSHNYLSTWSSDISGLVKLEILDLSNNSLTSLPSALCHDLDVIQKYTSVHIDIRGNDFKCVCDTENFVSWLTTTAIRFRNLNSTYCTLINGTVMSLSAKEMILNDLQQRCRKYILLIALSSTCLVLFVIILVVGILRRHRWKLEYLFYMALFWRKRTGYQTLDGTDDNPYGYDAFLSYEDSDRSMIREQVIPHLETTAGFKLCVDKRDFVPGFYITENILHAIQSSRKTVAFVSREFLKSNWCMYELNMAHMEGIYKGRDVLVVVLTENIPAKEISAEVMNIFKTQTYIEMPNNAEEEGQFWDRVKLAIGSN